MLANATSASVRCGSAMRQQRLAVLAKSATPAVSASRYKTKHTSIRFCIVYGSVADAASTVVAVAVLRITMDGEIEIVCGLDSDDEEPSTLASSQSFSQSPPSTVAVAPSEKPDNRCDYTKTVNPRKRIYGEEYRMVSRFTEQPCSKLIKIDQPEFRIVSSSSGSGSNNGNATAAAVASTGRSTNRAHPTFTIRRYTATGIVSADIPDLCPACYALTCICWL